MKKILSFLFFSPFLSLTLTAITIVIGGENGWEGSYSDNIVREKTGKTYLTNSVREVPLVTKKVSGGEEELFSLTDLAVNFEEPSRELDNTGNYFILSPMRILPDPKLKGNSFLRLNEDEKIELLSRPSAYFLRPGLRDEEDGFTIQFRFNSLVFENRERLFYYHNKSIVENETISTEVAYSFDKRVGVWKFSNFFRKGNQTLENIELRSPPLVPDVWYYVRLTYRAKDGLLEYYIDDELVDLFYSTESGRKEDIRPYYPFIESGRRYNIEIGEKFFGYLDDLYIIREFQGRPTQTKYRLEKKNIALLPISDMEFEDSILQTIRAKTFQTGSSQIRFYYRLGNDRKELYELSKRAFHKKDSLAEWTRLPANGSVNKKGRFLLIKVEFFSDQEKNEAPLLESVMIDYIPKIVPPPPRLFFVSVSPTAGILTWRPPVTELRAEIAYEIFIGEQPGLYHFQGSPFTVTGVTSLLVSGLNPGEEYFAVIRTYPTAATSRKSALSEVFPFRTE